MSEAAARRSTCVVLVNLQEQITPALLQLFSLGAGLLQPAWNPGRDTRATATACTPFGHLARSMCMSLMQRVWVSMSRHLHYRAHDMKSCVRTRTLVSGASVLGGPQCWNLLQHEYRQLTLKKVLLAAAADAHRKASHVITAALCETMENTSMACERLSTWACLLPASPPFKCVLAWSAATLALTAGTMHMHGHSLHPPHL